MHWLLIDMNFQMVGNNGKISDIGFTSATKGKVLTPPIKFSYSSHFVKLNNLLSKNIVNVNVEYCGKNLIWKLLSNQFIANTLVLRVSEFHPFKALDTALDCVCTSVFCLNF